MNALAHPDGNVHPLPDAHERDRERRQLQANGRKLLTEIRRLDLNFREYTIAELILELSLGWGLKQVIIPKLELFSSMTGVATSHIHTNMGKLVEMGLVETEKTPKGTAYRIIPTPETWRCRMRVSRASLREARNLIKMFNGLDETHAIEEHHHFFNQPDGALIFESTLTETVTFTDAQ